MDLSLKGGSVLFVDTAPFIYLFENGGPRGEVVSSILDQCVQRNIRLVTSWITYIEVLSEPARRGDTTLCGSYRDFLTNSAQLSIHALDQAVSEEAIRLRVAARLKTPDALQMACARICGASYFLTNDRDFRSISEPQVLYVDALVRAAD